MARSFSSQDAQDMIHQHNALLGQISEIRRECTRTEESALQYANQLKSSNSFAQIASDELVYGFDGVNPSIAVLLQRLKAYEKAERIEKKSKTLEKQYSDEISQAIRLLSATSTSALKWLFTSTENKAQSKLAYAKLKEMATGAYQQKIKELQERADNLSNETMNASELTDADSLSHCWKIFREACPRIYSDSRIPAAITGLEDEYSEITLQYEKLNEMIGSRKRNVKRAVDRMIAAELLKTLRGIPVDELNREGSGFRIKALTEHGYTTMADVFSAHAFQLSSVHGVSETAAYGMKRVANEYADKIKSDIRIRLSADNRSKEATGIVLGIYCYKRTSEILRQVEELRETYKPEISRLLRQLRTVDSDVSWSFDENKKKEKCVAAYQRCSQLIKGEYGNSIKKYLLQSERISHEKEYRAWEDFGLNNIQYFTILEELVPGALGNGDGLYGLPEELAQEIQDECFFPDGLNCSLRKYQEWGVKYILHQERVLLGDEMGLGKTVQAIAAMVSLKNTGATHFMVVCPASVLPNWCKEIATKSKLRVTKIHGPGRDAAFREWVKAGGTAVTTFETTGYCKPEEKFKFDLLVVDEAHYIKNPEARRTINLKKLGQHASRQLFMTGTALENNVDEMIELISILQPKIAADIRNIAFMSSAPQFRKRIAPVYYRRKREDVLSELPELIESKEWCAMTAPEEAAYEKCVLAKNYTASRRVSWNVNNLGISSKAQRLLELVEMAAEDNRKVIVFSFFLDTIKKVQELLGNRCVQPINGSVTAQRRQEIIDTFDKAPGGTVLPAQIQSGGTGLNIQSASVVVFCEPQLKPSIENQAVSRAYRMGQSRNVLVYRLLCENSLDERIIDLLAQKQAIFDAFADKSVAAAETPEIDNSTLGDIIKEEIARINAKQESKSTT